MTKELTQMHNMSIFHLIEQDTLTYNEKKKVLLLLMFLKVKRDTLVKVRMCTNGRKQKDSTRSKQETMLPSVVAELVFITAV